MKQLNLESHWDELHVETVNHPVQPVPWIVVVAKEIKQLFKTLYLGISF